MKDNHFKFSLSVLVLPLFFVLIIWGVFWAERKLNIDLFDFGIYPRTFIGLRGVLFSPFLHGSLEHLYHNTIPIFILLAAIRYFYREVSFRIFFYGILFTGIFTWIIGRPNYHIGASSLIYLLASFIFFKGILTKYYRLVALSMLVVLVYGGLIWYIFPDVQQGISWEGHLSGFIGGFVFSRIFKTFDYQKMARYDWQKPNYDPTQDKFMQRFDANGNFQNIPKVEETWEYFTSNLDVVYEVKS